DLARQVEPLLGRAEDPEILRVFEAWVLGYRALARGAGKLGVAHRHAQAWMGYQAVLRDAFARGDTPPLRGLGDQHFSRCGAGSAELEVAAPNTGARRRPLIAEPRWIHRGLFVLHRRPV